MRWPCRAAVTLLLFLVAAANAQRGSRRFPSSSTDNNLPEEDANSVRSHRFQSRDGSRRTSAVPRKDFPHRDAEVVPPTARGTPTRSSLRSRNEVSSREFQSRNEVPIVSSGAAEYERLQNTIEPSRRTLAPRGHSPTASSSAEDTSRSSSRKHPNDVDNQTARSAESLSNSPRRVNPSNRFSARGSTEDAGNTHSRKVPTTVQSPLEEPAARRGFSRPTAATRSSLRSSSQIETESPVKRVESARTVSSRGRATEAPARGRNTNAPQESPPPPELRSRSPDTARPTGRLPDTRSRTGGRSLNFDRESVTETPDAKSRARTSSRGSAENTGRSSFRSRESSTSKDGIRGTSRGRFHSRTETDSGTEAPTSRGRNLERFKSRAPKLEDKPSEPPVTVPTKEPLPTVTNPPVTADVPEEILVPKQEIEPSFASPEPVTTPSPVRETRTTVSSPLARGAARGNNNNNHGRGRGTARASTSDALLKAKKAAREAQQKLKLPHLSTLAPDTPSSVDNSKDVSEVTNAPTEPPPTLQGSRNFRKNLGRRGSRRDDGDANGSRHNGETPETVTGPKNGVRTGGPIRASPVFRPRSFGVDKDLKEIIDESKGIDSQAERSGFVATRSRGAGRGFSRSTRAPAVDSHSTTEPGSVLSTRKYESLSKFRTRSDRKELEKPDYRSLSEKRKNFQRLYKNQEATEPPIENSTPSRSFQRSINEPTEAPNEESVTERSSKYSSSRSVYRSRIVQDATEPPNESFVTDKKPKYSSIRSFNRPLSGQDSTEPPRQDHVKDATDSPRENSVTERSSRYQSNRGFQRTQVGSDSTEHPKLDSAKEAKPKYSSSYKRGSLNGRLSSQIKNADGLTPSLRPSMKNFERENTQKEEPAPAEENSENELIREETEGDDLRIALIENEDAGPRDMSKNLYNLEEKLELKTQIRPQQSSSGSEKSLYVPRSRDKDKEKFRARTEGQSDEATDVTPIKPRYHLYERQNNGQKKLVTPTIEITTPLDKYKSKYKFNQNNNERPSYAPPRKVYARTTSAPPSLTRYKERKESLSRHRERPGFAHGSKTKPFSPGLDEENEDEPENDDPLRHGFNGLSIDSLVSESEITTITTEQHNLVVKSTTKKPRNKYMESHVYRIPPRRRPGVTEAATVTTPFFFPTTEFLASLAQLTAETTRSTDGDDDSMTENVFRSDFLTESTTEMEIPTSTVQTTITIPPTTTTTTTTTTTPKLTTKKPKITPKPKPKTTPRATPKPKPKTKPTTKATTTTTPKPTTTTTTTPMPTTTTTEVTTTTTEEITTPPPTTTTTSTTTKKPTTKATTKKPTPKPTQKPKPKTTRKPKPTTKKPVTTTSLPPTTTSQTTTTTGAPTTMATTPKILTNPPVVVTYASESSSTTQAPSTSPIPEPTTSSTTTTTTTPSTTPTTTTPTPTMVQPITTTAMETPRVVTILSTLAQLANNLTAPTTTTPQYGNTAKIMTYTQETSTTPIPPPQNSTNFVVYGLLPNNNLVRKVVRTTPAPVDVPFIIYGLYPNGTIVRRYPNGTIVPDETEEGDNEVIANIEPGNKQNLEEAVKKDSPLSYLYPTNTLSSTEPSTTQTLKTTHVQKINPPTTAMPEIPTTMASTTEKVVEITTRKPTTMTTPQTTTVSTTKIPTTTKLTTKKAVTTRATTKKPATTKATTRKPTAATTKKPSTTKSTTKKPGGKKQTTTKTTVPTTTTAQNEVANATSTTTETSSSSITTVVAVTNVTTSTTVAAITNATTSATTAAPSAKLLSTTIKPTVKSTAKPKNKQNSVKSTSRPKSKKKSTTRPTSTTVKTTNATTTTTTTPSTTTSTTTPSTTLSTTTPSTTVSTTTAAPTTVPTTLSTTAKPKSKPKASKPKGTRKSKPKTTTSTTKSPISSISDVELLSNVLKSEKIVDAHDPINESEESLANKVIQLAIERATQKANNTSSTVPMNSVPSTTVSASSSNNTTTESVLIVTPEPSFNKTGKISLWVIDDDNSTTIPSKSSTVNVDNPDVDVINALLSTPGIDQLSIREQLILADVLSSTAFPPTTEKKKKKRPKTTTTTTTTTPRPAFPLLRALFGRSREPESQGSSWFSGWFRPFRNWAQGGGLLGGGLTGGYNSFRDQNQNFGGLGAETIATGSSSPSPVAFGDDQFGQAPIDVPPEAQRGLVGAAINVTRAVSQFMGFVIQGATQSFQNYLQTRTRALADALTTGPIS